MAIHNRVRPFGFWHTGSTITSGEFERLDDNGAFSVSSTGGTYNMADLLTIGGTGVTITAPFNATDAKYISVDTTLQIELGANIQLIGNQIVNTGALIGVATGAFITVARGGTLQCSAGSIATFTGTTTFNGNFITVACDAFFTFQIQQQNKLYKSGASATTVWRDGLIDPTQPAVTLTTAKDTHYVINPTSAGTTVYTINHTVPVAANGERMSVQVYGLTAAKDVNVIREDATIIATVTPGDGGIDLQYLGGRWRLVGYWGTVTLTSPY